MINIGWMYAFLGLTLLVHFGISFYARHWQVSRELNLYRELYRDEKKLNEQLVELIDSLEIDDSAEGWSDEEDWQDTEY